MGRPITAVKYRGGFKKQERQLLLKEAGHHMCDGPWTPSSTPSYIMCGFPIIPNIFKNRLPRMSLEKLLKQCQALPPRTCWNLFLIDCSSSPKLPVITRTCKNMPQMSVAWWIILRCLWILMKSSYLLMNYSWIIHGYDCLWTNFEIATSFIHS